MLEKLRNLEVDRLNIEEAVVLAAFGRNFKAEFAFQNCDVPEWLDARLRELSREISVRTQDALEAKLKKAKALRETLKPAEERRAELDTQIADLEAKLGVGA